MAAPQWPPFPPGKPPKLTRKDRREIQALEEELKKHLVKVYSTFWSSLQVTFAPRRPQFEIVGKSNFLTGSFLF